MNCNKSLKINKKAVADSFTKAANQYDQFAQLQRDIGAQLLSYVGESDFKHILDLGCGTGYFSERLAKLHPQSAMTCFDLSAGMLAQVAKKQLKQITCQQGDIDNLPYPSPCFELIFSNLVVQWSENLADCLNQLKGCLMTGGKLHFSTLLNGSLYELTQAWKSVDLNPHTNAFLSLDTLKQQIQAVGFKSVTIKTETRTLAYANVIDVMRALKGIGANHVHGHQNVKHTGRKLIKLLEQGYLPFVNNAGQLSLTYQVCYVEAEK